MDLEEVMDSDPEELAFNILAISKLEMGKNAPSLNKLICLIEDIQYIYQPSTVKKVSIHEAGHAVMDHHYGYKIEIIQIGGDIDAAGGVKSIQKSDFKKRLKENDRGKATDLFMAEIKKYCHVMLAGVAALYIYDGKGRIFPILGAEVDINNCKNLLKIFNIDSLTDQDIYSQFFPEAVKILEEKWKAVKALAQLLENRWSDDGALIDGEEAERIIRKTIEAQS
jgi:hypothetical protein